MIPSLFFVGLMFHLSYFIRSFVIIEQLVLSFTDEGFFVLTDDKSLAVTIPLSDIICRRVVFQQNYMFSDKANVISTDNYTAPEWNASTITEVKRKVHIVLLLKFFKPNLNQFRYLIKTDFASKIYIIFLTIFYEM